MEIDQLLDAVDMTSNWRTLYVEYLTHGKLPTDRDEARRIHRCAKSFVLIEGELYKRSIFEVMQ